MGGKKMKVQFCSCGSMLVTQTSLTYSMFPCFDGVKPATSALMEQMRCVYTVFAVCYQCGAETMTAWMEDELWLTLNPFLIHSHSSMLCCCLLSLTYRCDPWTKASLCSVISSPKLIFLIAVCCVYLSPTWVGFCKKHLELCLKQQREWKSMTKGFLVPP